MPPLLSTAMRGLKEYPVLLDTFRGVDHVAPPSVDRLNRILELFAVSSSQTTLMFPAASTAACGVIEKSALFETFFAAENGSCASAPTHMDSKPKSVTAAIWPKR